VAADRDRARLAEARREAERLGLSIEWLETDLERDWPSGTFDVVLAFTYPDRARMSRIIESVVPGGVLIMETFLEVQRQLGWGPTKEAHLLKHGEIATLVAPLEIVHGREAYEPADEAQWAALASVVAQRRK